MPAAVAIASCAQFAGTEKEDHQVIAALGHRGLSVTHAAWDDPSVDWSSFALVIIRSTWDYPQRIDEFLAWASRLPRVLNPLPILKWNTDKRYLNDLSEAGVPVIPTCFLEPGEDFEPPAEVYVVKPAISCGAKDTARYHAGQESQAHAHVRRLQEAGRTVMIQPYLAGIESSGEISMMFIGGKYSHSVCRGAMLNDKNSVEQISYPPNVRPYEATLADRVLADQVMASVPGGSDQLLFARIDLIPGSGRQTVAARSGVNGAISFSRFQPGQC